MILATAQGRGKSIGQEAGFDTVGKVTIPCAKTLINYNRVHLNNNSIGILQLSIWTIYRKSDKRT